MVWCVMVKVKREWVKFRGGLTGKEAVALGDKVAAMGKTVWVMVER